MRNASINGGDFYSPKTGFVIDGRSMSLSKGMDYLARTSDMEEELAKRFLSRLIEEYNGRVRMKGGVQ